MHPDDVRAKQHGGGDRCRRRELAIVHAALADSCREKRFPRRTHEERPPERGEFGKRFQGRVAVFRTLREPQSRIEHDGVGRHARRQRAVEARAKLGCHLASHRHIGRFAIHLSRSTPAVHQHQPGMTPRNNVGERRIIP